MELLTRLGRTPYRLLHERQRRRAIARLRAAPRPAGILVVCRGNIYRSPFAAAALRRALGAAGPRVESGGFIGPGRPAPPDALAAAARRGIDLTAHRSSLVTPARVRAAGLVVVMDVAQHRAVRVGFGRSADDVLLLGDLDPVPEPPRAIPDPWERGGEVCADVFARIERCVRELAALLPAP